MNVNVTATVKLSYSTRVQNAREQGEGNSQQTEGLGMFHVESSTAQGFQGHIICFICTVGCLIMSPEKPH